MKDIFCRIIDGEIPSFDTANDCEYIEKGGYTTQEMMNFTKERFE